MADLNRNTIVSFDVPGKHESIGGWFNVTPLTAYEWQWVTKHYIHIQQTLRILSPAGPQPVQYGTHISAVIPGVEHDAAYWKDLVLRTYKGVTNLSVNTVQA